MTDTTAGGDAFPAPGGDVYPIHFDIDVPGRIANWRPLVHWLLAIPQLIVAYLLSAVASIIAIVGFFAVLFTKRWPDSLIGLMALSLRYNLRVTSYVLFLREPYPPFEFGLALPDPGVDPARLDVDDPAEMQRWAPLYQWFLAIPHYIVLTFLFIAAFFIAIVGFFAVLFTGRWPAGLARFMVGVGRWGVRVEAYAYFMTNRYPPFTLD
jgi:Domain of unknown function (DUF4389)